jgi:hypothetical protein
VERNVRVRRGPRPVVVALALALAGGLLAGVAPATVGHASDGGPGRLATAEIPRSPPTYPVIFHETGLRSNTSWSVTLNGVPSNSAQDEVVFGEPNGTYSFTLVPPAGYAANVTSGNVTVASGPVTVEIEFSVAVEPAAPGPAGPPVWPWVVVGVLVVLGAFAVYFGWPRRPHPAAPPAPPDAGPPR